jgi:integration host factor subunit beta
MPALPVVPDHPRDAGVLGTKKHCDTLFRDAIRVLQMTRADLTEAVRQATELSRKEADVVVCAIFDSIVRALRSGDKVEIRGFGRFHTRQRRARVGRNPKTGASVEVPPKKIPFFKPGKEIRELVE